ncbi:hypothetical protein FRC12_009794 [Ceratobasidium sp. 428]|nr:hypothetical protein FRC12_009794 [Ceratobasidium sp. 428]
MAFSVEQILQSARADPHYLGNNPHSLLRWMPAGDGRTTVLVSSSPSSDPVAAPIDPAAEGALAVLKFIVQLRPAGCYVSPDGHYNPDDPTSGDVATSATSRQVTAL